MWDEEGEIETGGYLVVDNLAMGRPSMGGVCMLPDITPLTIFNLAGGRAIQKASITVRSVITGGEPSS